MKAIDRGLIDRPRRSLIFTKHREIFLKFSQKDTGLQEVK